MNKSEFEKLRDSVAMFLAAQGFWEEVLVSLEGLEAGDTFEAKYLTNQAEQYCREFDLEVPSDEDEMLKALSNKLFAIRQVLEPHRFAYEMCILGRTFPVDSPEGKTRSFLFFPLQKGQNHRRKLYMDIKDLLDKCKLYDSQLVIERLQREINRPEDNRLDPESKTVYLRGMTFPLTERQYHVVSTIAQAKGGFVSGEVMKQYAGSSERIDRIIQALHKMVRDCIQSKKGVGYHWTGPDLS